MHTAWNKLYEDMPLILANNNFHLKVRNINDTKYTQIAGAKKLNFKEAKALIILLNSDVATKNTTTTKVIADKTRYFKSILNKKLYPMVPDLVKRCPSQGGPRMVQKRCRFRQW